ncbi:MAG: hypothetical protein OXF26_12640 [Alphaproteobacteria bacterium]|nr:hypothetical protein [Alphaproteobacteria bacterium]MCY4319785.1 hypothetical protein [Alphaproteobacteria bacterium]
MLLCDPTVPTPGQNLRRAVALAELEGRTIGLLENGKLNALAMLRETAAIFEARHSCRVVSIRSKSNASAPAPEATLKAAVEEADFLITGLGD